jgi:hypothetical protein
MEYMPPQNDERIEGLMALMPHESSPSLDSSRRTRTASPGDVRNRVHEILQDSQIGEDIRDLLVSLVLLWNDQLDPCHDICQGYGHPEASYIHGMMHRREGDFGNAKYWFRRAQPLDDQKDFSENVASAFKTISGRNPDADYLQPSVWSPEKFVDACSQGNPADTVLKDVQTAEFHAMARHLFEHAG